MRTFKDLQQAVLRYFDVADEPDGSADVELVKNALNSNNEKRSTEERWKFMQSNAYSLAVVAGQQEYILPHTNLSKLHYLWSTTKNRWAIGLSMRQLPYSGLGFNQQIGGDSSVYYELTERGSVVAAQPSTASEIVANSTETEASNIQLYVEGEDASGQPLSETLDVGVPSAGVYSKVTYYAKIGDWTGTLSLETDPGAETLVTLLSSEYGKEYPILKWVEIPNANETFEYRYFRTPRRMVRDYDRPDLPYPHSGLLVYDTLIDLATYNELDSESVNIWRAKQLEALSNLYQLKLEGDTVAGSGNYINSGTGPWR